MGLPWRMVPHHFAVAKDGKQGCHTLARAVVLSRSICPDEMETGGRELMLNNVTHLYGLHAGCQLQCSDALSCCCSEQDSAYEPCKPLHFACTVADAPRSTAAAWQQSKDARYADMICPRQAMPGLNKSRCLAGEGVAKLPQESSVTNRK